MNSKLKWYLTGPHELEIITADFWLEIGTIWVTEYGQENTYYTDQFGRAFFCKNMPHYSLYGTQPERQA